MTKEELIEKLKKLYEKGKADYYEESTSDLQLDQDDYILEMAENILKSF